MLKFFQKFVFAIRFKVVLVAASTIRKTYYRFQGMKIGRGVIINQLNVTWPHQVQIGNDCRLEQGISFRYDGFWKPGPAIVLEDAVFIGQGCEFNISKSIQIGAATLIGSGCKFIDHDHGYAPGVPIRLQPPSEKSIQIGRDVWLGSNVIVLKGVGIGEGAIVGSGAVVNRSVPPYEIWAGIPAKKIADRRQDGNLSPEMEIPNEGLTSKEH